MSDAPPSYESAIEEGIDQSEDGAIGGAEADVSENNKLDSSDTKPSGSRRREISSTSSDDPLLAVKPEYRGSTRR